MGLKINLDNRTEFVPNLIATSKVQLDCQDPVAIWLAVPYSVIQPT